MCWSLAASAMMVTTGTAAATYTYRKGQPPAVVATLGYFAIMEALQTAGYLVVDQCNSPLNRAITVLSYLHIVFQPFFINAFSMALVPRDVERRIRTGVYALCGLSAFLMLLQLAPFSWAGACRAGQPLCGTTLCLRTGTWHIAWNIPFNGLSAWIDAVAGTNFGFPSYLLTVFVLPIVYGAWRFTLFHLFAGPLLASLLTRDLNELPAVWCLFSIAITVVAITPRLMGYLRVDQWPLWPPTWTAIRSP